MIFSEESLPGTKKAALPWVVPLSFFVYEAAMT